jgi:hypothetical protein
MFLKRDTSLLIVASKGEKMSVDPLVGMEADGIRFDSSAEPGRFINNQVYPA